MIKNTAHFPIGLILRIFLLLMKLLTSIFNKCRDNFKDPVMI